MKKVLIFALLVGASLPFLVLHSYGQNTTGSTFHKDVDSSPIEAVILINGDQNNTALKDLIDYINSKVPAGEKKGF